MTEEGLQESTADSSFFYMHSAFNIKLKHSWLKLQQFHSCGLNLPVYISDGSEVVRYSGDQIGLS